MISLLAPTASASSRGGTAIGILIAATDRMKVPTARPSLARRERRTAAATESAFPANGGAMERRTVPTASMKWSLIFIHFLVSFPPIFFL